jgi:2-dehydropantoate 2-reductase
MRVLVMGTGAIGGTVGSRFVLAGDEVVFVARGAHLAAIQERGLTIKSAFFGEYQVSATAVSDPAETGIADLVLFCTKTFDVEDAAYLIRPCVGPDTVILPVQNGVDIAERIGQMVGPEHVLGGVSWIGGHIEAPGVIVHRSPGGSGSLTFGELEGRSSERVEKLRADLERAGVEAIVDPNIRLNLWEKFVAMCANSAVTAVTRELTGVIFANPTTTALYRGLMEETAAVGRACGVPIADGYVGKRLEALKALPSFRASTAVDLLAGRRLETEALNGTVARLGKERGVPTPLNFAMYACLEPFINGTPSAERA